MGTGFSKKKKQAKMLQEQLSKVQEEIQHVEFTGTAGNGLVTVVLSGSQDLKQIKIKPECVDPEDVEGLEDLIKAAFKDASSKMKSHTGPSGMPTMPGMPGLDLGLFGKF